MLVIVGGASGADGEQEIEKLLALVDELDLRDRVRFVPPQPHHLLSTYYRAADVVLVPTRSESFGLVALEAAACGTPVVAAAVGGLLTLVDHGHTGFLVPAATPRSSPPTATSCSPTSAWRGRCRSSAARRAEHYTWSIAAARLRRLYADLTVGALVDCS